MKKIELLAPAGNMDSLIAAVQAGCDAVYLGGTLFSARAFAGNFSNEELEKAVSYCHLYGVKVYVTCNILVYEHEVERFLEYIDFLHKIMADAVLIQDLGMLDLVHKTYPNLEIHASTQMHIHNLDGVLMAQKLGCRRVVLARETPIEVIEDIIKKTNVEIEIFGHGSLCVSYSGECLFSSLIGKRSGNRGSCVGSCRLPYNIIDSYGNKLNKGDYPLSMKDLNTLDNLDKLINIGVTSLKIEGRMKSPEYVYTVTKLYRLAIDSYYEKGKVIVDKKELDNLTRLFSRGFTKGYLFHEDMSNIINPIRPNHQGIYIGKVIDYNKGFIKIRLADDVSINDGLRIILDDEDYGITLNEFYLDKKLVKEGHQNDVISLKVNKVIPVNSKVLLTKDISLINEINNIIKSNPRKVMVNIKVKAKTDESLEIMVSDNKHEVKVLGNIISKASNKPITKDDLESKISKIGDTIYQINQLDIMMDDNIFIPFKEINELRRELFDKLNQERLYKIDYIKEKYDIKVNDFEKKKLRSVLVNKVNNDLDYDIIYSENYDDNVVIKLPKVMDNYDNLDLNKEYLIGELGGFNKLKNVSCDYSFNVVNSYTVALLHSLGAKRITLSLELIKGQIDKLIKAYYERYQKHPNLEIIISGYREVMTLKTNLNKIYHNDNIYLQDRFNNKYKIREVNNLTYLYEPKKYYSDDDYYEIGVNILRDNKEI